MRARTGIAATLAGVLVAAGAGAAHGETITSAGLVQVKVVAPAPLTNAKIVNAVAKARAQAIPLAFTAARNQAVRLGQAAGLTPGAITSVEETLGNPYGGFYGYGTFGRFGPGQYCGEVLTVKRGPRVNGRRGPIISRRKVLRCYKPQFYVAAFTVTYTATPVLTQRPA